MAKDKTQKERDTRLWLRILLVWLTGTIPLFVVSLVLLNIAYGGLVDFGRQEQRGSAFQRPLEHLFEAVLEYQTFARQQAAGSPADPELLARARSQVDAALGVVTKEYQGELGQRLQFTDQALLSRDLGEARLQVLSAHWRELREATPTLAASGPAASALHGSILAMIRYAGDRSNLILDDDLDSFYLMDITLGALPETQQRIADLTTQVGAWARNGETQANASRVEASAAMLHQDLERIARDAKISLAEDAHFNGVSAPLQANLPAAVARFEHDLRPFLQVLDRVAAGEGVSLQDFESAAVRARHGSFDLFRGAADELDRLLALRVRAVQNKRLQGYSIIVTTLALAGFVMAMITRNLLAARYAEILESQEELRAKEAQLRALGDNLPGGMTYQVMRDFDGSSRFLYVSGGVERLHGVSVAEVLADASQLYDQILPEDLAAVRAAERESLVSKSAFHVLARTRRPDGAVRWMEFFSAPRMQSDGRPVWDGIQLDVTDRYLAEEVTKQSEQRFSRIFNNSPIPITLSGYVDGKFIAANDSFLQIVGRTREEVIGRTTLELGMYSDPAQRAVLFEQLRAHGHLHGYEQEFVTKSGRVRHNLLWVDVITIGEEQCVLTISLDLTEKRLAEEQQQALEEQLRQAQKLEALGTLAGGIAHDFNNILGAIISYVELSKLDNPHNRELQENLDEVLRASGRATTLVRQILSFSRRQKEEQKNLQLAPIIKEALSLLRASLPATISLNAHLEAALPDVLANATQVHQIIMNLCTNAAHAVGGEQGQINVELDRAQVAADGPEASLALPPGDYVRLTVRDTGQGMDAATAKRIFEPFFTTKASGEGTGLGLSVVHGIVKEYGGEISVVSEVGRGTSMKIYLPARPAVESQPTAPATEIPRGNGARILYVDDEAVLGDVAQKMLKRLGYEATVFQSSEAAWAAFEAAPQAYDALVTDLTMPALTGVDLARKVLALRPALPIILVSGSSGPLTVSELRAMGIRELLSKPLNYGALARVLNQVLYGQ